ncbi:hypothetical protein HW555_011649 [Spodoptera exigua]|uniref:Uncharacterized protein n=1 Tax=Spodoptera exigua TaxID=7107 RepID=A0A835G4W7_SPOEX|nr:hypothetical protein HW555_011649 [Spodoptera exigua]
MTISDGTNAQEGTYLRVLFRFPTVSSASLLAPDEDAPCIFGYLARTGFSSTIDVTLYLLPSDALMCITPS